MYPDYNDSDWSTPKENTEFSGTPTAQAGAFVKVRKDLERTPEKITVYEGATDAFTGYYGRVKTVATYNDGDDIILNPGQTLLVDFGQNFAGFESFEITSQRGTTVTVDHGEMLNDGNGAFSRGNDGPEGSIYEANYRTAKSDTIYVPQAAKTKNGIPHFPSMDSDILKLPFQNPPPSIVSAVMCLPPF